MPFAKPRLQSQAEYVSNHSHRDPVAGHAVTPAKVPEGCTDHAGWDPTPVTAATPPAPGRIPPEWVAGMTRNSWPDSIGMGGRFAPQIAFTRPLVEAFHKPRDRH